MGVSIGLSRGFDWAPRPGRRLCERLSAVAEDELGDMSLSFSAVRQVCEKFLSEDISDEEAKLASEFVDWWGKYWDEAGLGEDETVDVLFS